MRGLVFAPEMHLPSPGGPTREIGTFPKFKGQKNHLEPDPLSQCLWSWLPSRVVLAVSKATSLSVWPLAQKPPLLAWDTQGPSSYTNGHASGRSGIVEPYRESSTLEICTCVRMVREQRTWWPEVRAMWHKESTQRLKSPSGRIQPGCFWCPLDRGAGAFPGSPT